MLPRPTAEPAAAATKPRRLEKPEREVGIEDWGLGIRDSGFEIGKMIVLPRDRVWAEGEIFTVMQYTFLGEIGRYAEFFEYLPY